MISGQLGMVLRHIRKLAGAPVAEGLTDRQLLERFVAHRDEGAFATLVERHGPMVLAVCRRGLGNNHDAEDAFQATFLVLARRAGALHWQDTVRPWLYGVARRVALKARAAAGQRQVHETQAGLLSASEGVCACDGEPPADAIRHELRQVLDEELSRLPNKHRAALVLCYLQGKTNEEAARELGWATGSMSRHLTRAREMLRERLIRRGLAPSVGMLATIMTEDARAANVPVALADSTVKLAKLFVDGAATAAGALSAAVFALAEGMLHTMAVTKLKIVSVLLMTVVLVSAGTGGVLRYAGATPSGDGKTKPAAPVAVATVPKAKPKNANPEPSLVIRIRELQDKMTKPITLDHGIDRNPLKDALEFMSDRFSLTIVVDEMAFREDKIEDVESQQVKLPKMAGVQFGTVLNMLSGQVNGVYLIRPDYIEITTRKRAWPSEWAGVNRHMAPTVDAIFEKRPLGQALQELAQATGINVLLDARVTDKVDTTAVTATLHHVPLDTAVLLLADMADLKAVAIDNVLYVTTKANADALQVEQERRKPRQRQLEPKRAAPAKTSEKGKK